MTAAKAAETEEWMKTTKLVVKPDQLIKRRGKMGLVKVDKDIAGVDEVLKDWMHKEIDVQGVKGELERFIVEPFVKHTESDEHYLCIRQLREGDEILFCKQGGVDVGNVEDKASVVMVKTGETLTKEMVEKLVNGLEGFNNYRYSKICYGCS
jgi:ATP citrate (pro-S)-lyase